MVTHRAYRHLLPGTYSNSASTTPSSDSRWEGGLTGRLSSVNAICINVAVFASSSDADLLASAARTSTAFSAAARAGGSPLPSASVRSALAIALSAWLHASTSARRFRFSSACCCACMTMRSMLAVSQKRVARCVRGDQKARSFPRYAGAAMPSVSSRRQRSNRSDVSVPSASAARTAQPGSTPCAQSEKRRLPQMRIGRFHR